MMKKKELVAAVEAAAVAEAGLTLGSKPSQPKSSEEEVRSRSRKSRRRS